jgi:hypothetical protein
MRDIDCPKIDRNRDAVFLLVFLVAVHESASGPFRTSRDVRFESAMRGKTDVTRTSSNVWL